MKKKAKWRRKTFSINFVIQKCTCCLTFTLDNSLRVSVIFFWSSKWQIFGATLQSGLLVWLVWLEQAAAVANGSHRTSTIKKKLTKKKTHTMNINLFYCTKLTVINAEWSTLACIMIHFTHHKGNLSTVLFWKDSVFKKDVYTFLYVRGMFFPAKHGVKFKWSEQEINRWHLTVEKWKYNTKRQNAETITGLKL